MHKIFNCDLCGDESNRRVRLNKLGQLLCDGCNALWLKQIQRDAYSSYNKTDKRRATAVRYKQTDKGKAMSVRASSAYRKRMSDDDRARMYRRHHLKSRYGIEYLPHDTCTLCGTTEDLSLDHLHPRSLGGGDDLVNLGTLCRSCNAFKGPRLMTPGRALLIGDIKHAGDQR